MLSIGTRRQDSTNRTATALRAERCPGTPKGSPRSGSGTANRRRASLLLLDHTNNLCMLCVPLQPRVRNHHSPKSMRLLLSSLRFRGDHPHPQDHPLQDRRHPTSTRAAPLTSAPRWSFGTDSNWLSQGQTSVWSLPTAHSDRPRHR